VIDIFRYKEESIELEEETEGSLTRKGLKKIYIYGRKRILKDE